MGALYATLMFSILFSVLGTVDSACTIKNSSSSPILVLPLSAPSVKIKVNPGEIVEIPVAYLNSIIKNLVTGALSAPLKLLDGAVLVCVDGVVKGTISIYPGGLLNGVISLVSSALPILEGL
ncbi:hypothetical protein KP509_12G055300 [Ceratopteris richardii]|nr:hypothetical protein KP509_12G055300 [Ceratopteris richardii]